MELGCQFWQSKTEIKSRRNGMKIKRIIIEVQLGEKESMEIKTSLGIKTSLKGRDEEKEFKELEASVLKIGNILATSIREIIPKEFF